MKKKKDFCNVIVSFEDTKILEYNQYQKCDKVPFIIYADLECLTLIRLVFLKVVFSKGGGEGQFHPLHISRRTYLISIKHYTIVERSI